MQNVTIATYADDTVILANSKIPLEVSARQQLKSGGLKQLPPSQLT